MKNLIPIIVSIAMPLLSYALKPSEANLWYWTFNGQTAPLIGGSSEDNLFQESEAAAEMAQLAAAGGNYVRCAMSSRDEGNLWPFAQDPDTGLYDLEAMDPEFWERFADFIREADRLGIVVQIEVFDRFDYFRKEWKSNPFNPDNNINYDADGSGLTNDYPAHPNAANNPFFRTPPALEDNPLVRRYQERFVEGILEVTLPYENVLYCISNETKESAEWGAYWARFIHDRADEAGKTVYVTEMWDARDLANEEHQRTWGHPEIYDFVDISQVNHNVGQAHWEQLMAFRETIIETGLIRPMNSVKIYGANSGYYGTTRDAQERFWRNLLAGLATARFHRPNTGLGARPIALENIRAARSFIDAFDLTLADPREVYLHGRSANEAYGTGSAEQGFAVFFPDGGDIILRSETPAAGSTYALRWLDIRANTWTEAGDITLSEKSETRLVTPEEEGYWIAVLQASN